MLLESALHTTSGPSEEMQKLCEQPFRMPSNTLQIHRTRAGRRLGPAMALARSSGLKVLETVMGRNPYVHCLARGVINLYVIFMRRAARRCFFEGAQNSKTGHWAAGPFPLPNSMQVMLAVPMRFCGGLSVSNWASLVRTIMTVGCAVGNLVSASMATILADQSPSQSFGLALLLRRVVRTPTARSRGLRLAPG